MSSCLDETRSCSGVGLDGSLISKVESIACHLVSMGVALWSRVEELRLRFFTCLGVLGCRICGSKRLIFGGWQGFYPRVRSWPI